MSSRRSVLAAAFVWLATSWCAPTRAAATPEGVQLLPSGASLVHLIVEAADPELVPLASDPSITRLVMPGYEPIGPMGSPALPERVLLVAVPPTGEVSVSASGAEPTVREGVDLASGASDDGKGGTVMGRDPVAYGRAGSIMPRRARLLDVGWMRNQRVARIAVTPADYDPVARRLTWVHRVDVSVAVQPVEATTRPFEAEDPFEGTYREALVNYEQGRAWRRPARAGLAAGMGRGAGRFAMTALPETTIFAGRRWVKFAIPRTGFYKVEKGQVRNTSLFGGRDSIYVQSLRLFTWPGYPVLFDSSFCDTCGYREVAIQPVERNNNQLFDLNDEYFYFFALGPSDWANLYDPSFGDTVFLEHPYETHNFYYLTIDDDAAHPLPGPPKRIETQSGLVQGIGAIPTTFPARVHYEQDYEYFPNPVGLYGSLTNVRQGLYWEKWMWKSINIGNTFSVIGDAPGIDDGQPMRVRARAWGISSAEFCNGSTSFRPHLLDVSVNSVPLRRMQWNQFGFAAARTVDTTLFGGLASGNNVAFTVPPRQYVVCPNQEDVIGVAWVQLLYRRRFEAIGDSLTFDSDPGAGDWHFQIDSLSSIQPHVFDVTDPITPFEIVDCAFDSIGPGDHRLAFERHHDGVRRYRIIPDGGIVRLENANVLDPPVPNLVNENLRSPTLGADHVIIYYDRFQAAAETLAVWRRERLPVPDAGPYEVVTVPVSAVYDQFSGGRTDPGAMRDFLRAAFFNWSRRPRFVTLLGDASYDFKNLKGLTPAGQPGALIPSYEYGFDISISPGRQFASDDWIMNVDSAGAIIPDFFAGRIPAMDATGALAYVRKMVRYESDAPLGDWRNRVMLVADDDQKPGGDILMWTHLAQTAALDEVATPGHIDRRYVYLHKYPDTPGGTKQGAREAIFREVDAGVAMFNYVGHGSQFKIADESVFIYSDPSSLTNGPRATVFVSASCDVGKFNDPELQGLGERLVMLPSGGAVGSISATEEANSLGNALLNQRLYRNIFDRDTLAGTGQYHVGLSEALLRSKGGGINDAKYQLMGDAGVRLDLPRRWVTVSLWDSAGTTPVTDLQRGQTLMVRGEVHDSPASSAPLVGFDGNVDLLIEDAAPIERAPDCRDYPGCLSRPYYHYFAGAIFRGGVTARSGRFETRFVVPLEARTGTRGRVRAYLSGHAAGEGFSSDGVGSDSMPVIPGVSTLADNQGPRISLSFAGGSRTVRRDATLRVDLFDPSGILTTGHSPQNGVIVTIDDNSVGRVDITSSFQYAADSYQSGTASFQLPNLAPGPHKVSVSAADNLALGLAAGEHRSSAEIDFEVVDTPPLNVSRTYLFPSPTRSGPGGGGVFVVDAPGDSINVLLRVYTVTGRLIRVLQSPGGLGQVQLPWDGLDAEGDELANGVYLYKVYVYARESGGTSSARQRAIGEGRFVIVNR